MEDTHRGSKFVGFVLFLFFATPCITIASTEQAREAAAVIAPPELIAAYSCALYAESQLLPIAVERGKAMIKQGRNSVLDVKKLLQEYDDVIAKMCSDIAPLFMRRKEDVINAYARQVPGWSGDVRSFLARPGSQQWASNNAEFLATTVPLVQLFYLVRDVAPEFVEQAMPNMQNRMGRLDEKTFQEVSDASVGLIAEKERLILVHLLSDKRFQEVAPRRYKLSELAGTEQRLRRETLRVKNLLRLNGNANDLIRMHFGDFDVMRQLGVPQILERYRAEVLQLGR